MRYNTDNTRISSRANVVSANALIQKYPLTDKGSEVVWRARESISRILSGRDERLMVIVGPCSIHDPKAAREYASLLADKIPALSKYLYVVMRVYFEKPRTITGWKGLINDPDLNDTFDMNKGLEWARHLMVDLIKMRLPIAVEYLDLITPQYFSDLISWGAIGARTTESQSHRELASALSCPVGFKNSTTGSIRVAIDAVQSAQNPHHLLSVNKDGGVSHYASAGNLTTHVILRGGGGKSNYDEQTIIETCNTLKERGLNDRLMVDFSHENSNKMFKNQLKVSSEICRQISSGSNHIFGVMIESNLFEGNQKIANPEDLRYGVSITDECLGWEDTVNLLDELHAAQKARSSL